MGRCENSYYDTLMQPFERSSEFECQVIRRVVFAIKEVLEFIEK